jgi:hypothetical protein
MPEVLMETKPAHSPRLGTLEAVQGGCGMPTLYHYRYSLPNGERRVLSQSVANDPAVNMHALLDVVEDTLEKRARSDIEEYVRQNTHIPFLLETHLSIGFPGGAYRPQRNLIPYHSVLL